MKNEEPVVKRQPHVSRQSVASVSGGCPHMGYGLPAIPGPRLGRPISRKPPPAAGAAGANPKTPNGVKENSQGSVRNTVRLNRKTPCDQLSTTRRAPPLVHARQEQLPPPSRSARRRKNTRGRWLHAPPRATVR